MVQVVLGVWVFHIQELIPYPEVHGHNLESPGLVVFFYRFELLFTDL